MAATLSDLAVSDQPMADTAWACACLTRRWAVGLGFADAALAPEPVKGGHTEASYFRYMQVYLYAIRNK